jgi:ribokinase
MVEVTVVGDVNIDVLTAPIPEYPKKDCQVRIEHVHVEVGGGAAHTALALSKLGVKTALVGIVGTDCFGNFIIQKTKDFGVISKLKRCEGKTGVSIGISFTDGSRSLLTYTGTNRTFSSKQFKLEDLQGRVLFVSGYGLMESFQKDVPKVLKYARQQAMATCLEPDIKSGVNFDIRKFKAMLRFVDLFFPDLEEGKILTGEKDEEKIAEKILGFGCKIVALKLGERGCLVADEEKFVRVGAIETNALNPTGAGDFFNAGFIFGYLKHGKIEKAGEFGNAVASFAISRFWDERYPSKAEIERLVSNF